MFLLDALSLREDETPLPPNVQVECCAFVSERILVGVRWDSVSLAHSDATGLHGLCYLPQFVCLTLSTQIVRHHVLSSLRRGHATASWA